MLKETVTYTDYNGRTITEELWFNLSNTELMKLFNSIDGDPTEKLRKALADNDTTKFLLFFGDLVMNAYGEKSADGKRFIKSPEIKMAFEQSAAFDALYTRLVSNGDEIINFIKGIIPSTLQNQINFDQITNDAAQGVLPID